MDEDVIPRASSQHRKQTQKKFGASNLYCEYLVSLDSTEIYIPVRTECPLHMAIHQVVVSMYVSSIFNEIGKTTAGKPFLPWISRMQLCPLYSLLLDMLTNSANLFRFIYFLYRNQKTDKSTRGGR